MKVKKNIIFDSDAKKLIEYLKSEYPFKYENSSDQMLVLGYEDYYFRNNTTQFNVIIIKLKDNQIQLDLIAAGGGESIFNISYWSKNSFINKVNKIIIRYCLENNIQMEEGEINSNF